MSNLNPGGLTRVLNYIKTWVTGLLNGKANSSHTHTKSQITDFPAYGSTAGTICQGNDSRLSDARTPYFANGTWYSVGDDAAIGDHNVGGGLGVKALNSTTTRIDLCYKDDASNYKSITYDGTTLYMNGNCNYATSAGSVAWGNVTNKPNIRTDILHFATVSSLDANTISEDGIWYVYGGINGAPMSNHGVLVYVKSVGTPFQMYFPDNLLYVYKRIYTSGAWGSWEKMNSRSWDDIQYINGYKVYVG